MALPEAFLQNIAYRHADTDDGPPPAQALIGRLLKLQHDPAWEVVLVPAAAGSPLAEEDVILCALV